MPLYEGKITLLLKQGKDISPKRKTEISFAVNIETKIVGRKIIK